jgi:hypothetical protein
MNSAPTDLGSRWAGFQSDIHENVYKIFSRSLPLCGQRCSVISKTILEAKLVDAEECPTCGGVGFVTQRADPRGEAESVAFVRFECPTVGARVESLRAHMTIRSRPRSLGLRRALGFSCSKPERRMNHKLGDRTGLYSFFSESLLHTTTLRV